MKHFYLGRPYSLSTKKNSPESLFYDPADLTTHAVVTGMTGSGKTGLCIVLMEEAALQGIPALIIDPKGDLTNLLLHFPDFSPADFQPWLDADHIRRAGKSLEQSAIETAATWKNGLAEWGVTPDTVRALKNAVQYNVFTPGSDAGTPVSVLASLQAPSLPWEGNREVLREKISATVTALLGLAGLEDIDPVRSREHILLSNIFEAAWSKGKSLDLTELILQTQTPPFEKLGAFPVEKFFPEKDRLALAMLLNNILASPTFESWREGAPLDIPALLYTPEGKPRHSIFYIAHLSDAERMFFVTLLLSAFETWMRTQAGSSSLRALIYFDEIYGYLPPQRNPPSKQPLLRLLKQARAFGVGLLLATQNPVDMDYKALANAGTWFVGKLQTERDKERLLDGLESLNSSLDRAAFAQIIPALGRRIFLLHNVHESGPVTFQTRWTMNYLAGPLTRAQIPALNRVAGATPPARPASGENPAYQAQVSFGAPPQSISPAAVPVIAASRPPQTTATAVTLPGSATRPAIPFGISEYFLPLSFSLSQAFKAASERVPQGAEMAGVLYKPVLLASAQARIIDRRYAVDTLRTYAALVDEVDKRGMVRWDDWVFEGIPPDKMESIPALQPRYESMPAALTDAKLMATLQRDFAEWVYRSAKVTVRTNPALKISVGPDASLSDFRTACANAARAGRDAELAKVLAKLDKEIASLQHKLEKEQIELDADEETLDKRSLEKAQADANAIFGVFGKRGKINRFTHATEKGRMRERAKAEVKQSKVTIAHLKTQIAERKAERARQEQEISARWAELADDMVEVALTARKSDIFVEQFGVAWMPYYLIKTTDKVFELPAFGAG